MTSNSPERSVMRHTTRRRLAWLVALGVVAVAGCRGDDGDTATDLGQDGIGTCLNIADTVGAEIDSLPTVECTESHTHEIYAVLDSEAETYPGFEALEAEAQVRCLEEFEPYVGISAFDSNLFYSWMVPTLASWEDTDIGERGDREILCVVGSKDGEPLNNTVRNSGA